LAQSEHVFLLFSFKLVHFSSNFSDLDANFFDVWDFLIFEKASGKRVNNKLSISKTFSYKISNIKFNNIYSTIKTTKNGLLDLRVFSSRKLALSAFCQEDFSFPRLALRNLHLFLLKMLITTTATVTLPVFAVSIAISSAFVVSLRAILATLIGQGL
jgi:hypothetical protein